MREKGWIMSGAAARTGKGKEKRKKKYIKNVEEGSVYKKTQETVRRAESKNSINRIRGRCGKVGNKE